MLWLNLKNFSEILYQTTVINFTKILIKLCKRRKTFQIIVNGFPPQFYPTNYPNVMCQFSSQTCSVCFANFIQLFTSNRHIKLRFISFLPVRFVRAWTLRSSSQKSKVLWEKHLRGGILFARIFAFLSNPGKTAVGANFPCPLFLHMQKLQSENSPARVCARENFARVPNRRLWRRAFFWDFRGQNTACFWRTSLYRDFA